MTIDKTDPTFKAQLAVIFNQVNRELMIADKPETWQPAIKAMSAFLDEVADLLSDEPELIGEDLVLSSRIFSLLLTVTATATQGRLELYKGKDEKGQEYQAQIENDYLPLSGDLRRKAIDLAKVYLSNPVFYSLKRSIVQEIFPLLDSLNDQLDPDRFTLSRNSDRQHF